MTRIAGVSLDYPSYICNRHQPNRNYKIYMGVFSSHGTGEKSKLCSQPSHEIIPIEKYVNFFCTESETRFGISCYSASLGTGMKT